MTGEQFAYVLAANRCHDERHACYGVPSNNYGKTSDRLHQHSYGKVGV